MKSKLKHKLNKNFNGFSVQRWDMLPGLSSITIHFKEEEQLSNNCQFFNYDFDEYDLFLSDRDLCDNWYDEFHGVDRVMKKRNDLKT